jgi:hypothetical protein
MILRREQIKKLAFLFVKEEASWRQPCLFDFDLEPRKDRWQAILLGQPENQTSDKDSEAVVFLFWSNQLIE